MRTRGHNAVQAKLANGLQNKKQPLVAPYRPQPVPIVLQTKRTPGQNVYRPEPKKIVQPKVIAAQRQSPTPPVQMKTRPVAPPVYRPQPMPKVLQTKRSVGSPPGAIQRSQSLHARNVVQRDVDLKTAVMTENRRYLIDPADNTVLYSVMGAIPPRPTGLYQRTLDRTAGSHIPLNAWTPNVRFLSKEENIASPVKGKPGQYEYIKKGFVDSTKRFSLRGLGDDVLSPPEIGERPTIGVFGKNDCYAFGDALQNLMMMNGELPLLQTGRKKKNVHVTAPDHPRDLELQVGDMMRHIYIDNPHCKYHAATVVAKDGESLVTLEGHVSKNLRRPQFLIHNGVRDFAHREIRGGYGDEVEITPLEGLNPELVAEEREDFVRRFRRMMGEDTDYGFMTAQVNLGFHRTDEYPRQLERARIARELDELRRGRWVERMRAKWNRSLQVGRVTVNNSIEGNRFIGNEML
ncbi:MAG TPA: hypothetical protein VFI24_02920 [Pyrinomonadaceae bacterium]|nr:hypothetical protein [Pyrinomonadaceae bacterium]